MKPPVVVDTLPYVEYNLSRGCTITIPLCSHESFLIHPLDAIILIVTYI